jgi:hypothetical protein
MSFAVAEFGPSSWTIEQWIGVGVYVGAFFISVALIRLLAVPNRRAAGRSSADGKVDHGR